MHLYSTYSVDSQIFSWGQIYDHIATLCNIAQRRQDFGHPPFAAFVDLCAAFDSLSRPALWLLLTRLGIPGKIVRLFRVLYDNSVSCVRTGGTHSSW